MAIFCASHSAGPTYDGEQFRFCPWCGATLRKSNQEGILNIRNAMIDIDEKEDKKTFKPVGTSSSSVTIPIG
jgi:hypothetical protein